MSIKIKKFPYDRIKQSFVDSFDTSKLAKVSKGNKQTLLNPDGSVNRNKLDTLLKSKELKPFIADILTPPEVQWGVKKLDSSSVGCRCYKRSSIQNKFGAFIGNRCFYGMCFTGQSWAGTCQTSC